MKQKLFILTCILSESLLSSAQITFQRNYNPPLYGFSSCLSVETTSDNGFIAAGNHILLGNSDACVTKTNSGGEVEWSETFGDLRSENIFSVQQTIDGSYIVAGTSRSFSVDSLNEIYILRLSASGNVEWEKIYGSTVGAYEVGAHRIYQTTDGGFIIGGYEDDFNVGMLYLKIDSLGTISWGKYISGSIGTYGVESIQQTTDSGFIITGNGGKLIKTDASGNISWSKSYINGAMSFYAQQTTDGGYMLTGETNILGSGGMDMYLIKTDASGNALWCKTFGGSLDDNLRSAQQTSDGGYILSGSTNSFLVGSYSDIYVVKTDPSGNHLWSKTYGGPGSELGFSIREDAAGGFIIGGSSSSFFQANSAYLIKTDTSGASGCYNASPLTLVTSPIVVATTLSETASTFIPDTFTPVSNIGGGLTAVVLCLNWPSAVEELNNRENNISIAPNPVINYFTVGFNKNIKNGTLEILDVLGERISTVNINDETEKVINLPNISPGIYVVNVHDGEKYFSRKIIIEPN